MAMMLDKLIRKAQARESVCTRHARARAILPRAYLASPDSLRGALFTLTWDLHASTSRRGDECGFVRSDVLVFGSAPRHLP